MVVVHSLAPAFPIPLSQACWRKNKKESSRVVAELVETAMSGRQKYYDALGVPSHATEAEIKAAYKRLALRWL